MAHSARRPHAAALQPDRQHQPVPLDLGRPYEHYGQLLMPPPWVARMIQVWPLSLAV